MSEAYNRRSTDKGALAATQSIAIVSPISTVSWRQAFTTALPNNGNGIVLTWDDQNPTTAKPYGYGTKKNYKALTDAIKSHDNAQTGLIVTTGGNIAYRAAVDARLQQTPFISLLGDVPARGLANFYGGVALQSWLANDARINFMVGKGYHAAEIGLFCNRRSAIHADEITLWHGSEYYSTGGGNNNDPTAFANEFGAVDDSIKALIISADPFFQDNKVLLINACNTWIGGNPAVRKVCYPLADYANVPGTTPVPPGTSFWYGPNLSNAYTLLGQVAGTALQTGAAVPFLFTADLPGQLT
jgi:hypothetical protein